MVKGSDSKQAPEDPVGFQIQQEVEEFLRDLTLEYPFSEVFEILRRREFQDRFGSNVTPLPQKKFNYASMKEIEGRIQDFLEDLRRTFGRRYYETIEDSFRYYTVTTVE